MALHLCIMLPACLECIQPVRAVWNYVRMLHMLTVLVETKQEPTMSLADDLCCNVQVLMVDVEKRALVVKGSVPGKPGCVVEITPGKIVGKTC